MPNSKIRATNDPVLDRIVRGYSMPAGSLIHDDVLPTINVTADKGDILSTGNTHFSLHNNVRGGHTTTPELEFSLSVQDGWSIKKRGLKALVTEEDANGYNPMNPRAGFQTAKNRFGMMLRQAQMLATENALAGAVQNAASYAASNKKTLSGTDQYSDLVNSDPIVDALEACDAIYDATGLPANLAIIPWKVFKYLQYNEKLIAKLSNDSNRTMGLTAEQMAVALGVDRVLVPFAMKNTAEKGKTTVKSPIWTDSVSYLYVNPNPTPMEFEESFGYSYRKTEVTADTYKVDDPKNAEYVRVVEDYDDVILNFGAGYLISDAIA